MIRNDHYILKKLYGVPYLMPYGQSIADLSRGIRLNGTSEFLWNLLASERTEQELINACSAYYAASEDELPELKTDLEMALKQLASLGALTETDDIPTCLPTPSLALTIAGQRLQLHGPVEAFSDHFDAFRTDMPTEPGRADQIISLQFDPPRQHKNGQILLRNRDLMVIDSIDRYVLIFPAMPQILEAHLSKDGSLACFYCEPPLTETFRENLFHAIRLVFLYLISERRMGVLHSASLLYQDRAWLFSAPSGTGKSTHTGLWHRLLHAPLINGDLNILALEDGIPVIHGLPWCGTSGICDTHTYPLGGIILLRQAPSDLVEELSPDGKLLQVQHRLITPCWTTEMLNHNLDLVKRLISHILICRLHCTPSGKAVETIRERIDRFLEEDPDVLSGSPFAKLNTTP